MWSAALAATLLIAGVAGDAAGAPVEVARSMEIRKISSDLAVMAIADPAWELADKVTVKHYWSGEAAPVGRQFEVRLLWSDAALYVRFEANQAEPLVMSDKPDLSRKQMGLWDRDVCEIFLAPDAKEPRKYYEFEAAPNGEWLDVAIDLTSGKRASDWEYASGMQSSARVDRKIVIAIKIPWPAFGKKPRAGDVWLGNLLRCVGRDPGRGYLAWQPTLTKEPAFHVPEKFGEFRFVG